MFSSINITTSLRTFSKISGRFEDHIFPRITVNDHTTHHIGERLALRVPRRTRHRGGQIATVTSMRHITRVLVFLFVPSAMASSPNGDSREIPRGRERPSNRV